MRARFLPILFVFATASLVSQAGWTASYYVDSVAGKDTNTGLSTSSAWKTIAKVNTSTPPFGSTIFLKRGAVWHEQLDLPASGLTVDAYGSGVLPTFEGSEPVTGWKSEGNGLYSKTFTLAKKGDVGGLGNITENGAFMTLVNWKTSGAATLGSAPTGTYTFQYSNDKLWIKPATAPSGKTYRASTLLIGIHATGRSDITIQNVSFTRQSLFGIRFNDCDRCTARNSTIADGGGAVVDSLSSPYLYTGNGIEYSGKSHDGLVEGMTIRNMFDSGVTPQTYTTNSELARITFRNSTIERCGYAGVEISALPTGLSSTISGIKVSGMTIRDSGRGWSGNRYGSNAHGVLIQANSSGSISGVVVENTTVGNSVGDGVKITGDVGTVTLNRLILVANTYGISVPNAAGTAGSLKLVLTSSLILGNRSYGLYYYSPSAAGFNVFHNTFYDNGAINFAVFGQNGQAYIKNNIFASSITLPQLYVDGTSGLRGASINNNCWIVGKDMIGYKGAKYATLPPFVTATQLETNGVGTSNVLFNNPSSFDFGLQATSPCLGRGATDTGVALDLIGSPFKTPPSMGALERYAVEAPRK